MATDVLTAANAIVVFADLQEGIINIGATTDTQKLRTSVGALADLATIFALPVVISCVPTTGGTVAPLLAEISARLPAAVALIRTTANAMDDGAFQSAIEDTGRRTLIIAGVATEVAVRLPALCAQRAGYSVVIAVDACSGIDSRTELATFTHLSGAGVELSSVAAIAAQLAGDFGSTNGRAAMRALQSTLTLHPHHEHTPPLHNHDHGGATHRA